MSSERRIGGWSCRKPLPLGAWQPCVHYDRISANYDGISIHYDEITMQYRI